MASRFKSRAKDRGRSRPQREVLRLPERLPLSGGCRLVRVFVEGYEDVAFWRGIFDDFESSTLSFEISVPPRDDLAKGKRVLMSMIPECSKDMVVCVDSDFDYLFANTTPTSYLLNNSEFLFHTYAYATENYSCYAPSLHNVCVKATKNDMKIFDFELFMEEYSKIIYPIFVWYAYSARMSSEHIFTLVEFRATVKLNYLEVEHNGANTLEWLRKQVDKRVYSLVKDNPVIALQIDNFAEELQERGVSPENTYLFMQGHTLMDNVVMIILSAVCEKLKMINNQRISSSLKFGVSLRNEISNYNNSLRNLRDILLDNESYKECFLYQKLREDIQQYIAKL